LPVRSARFLPPACFGPRVKEAREYRGFSQRELVRRLGYNYGSATKFSRIERGDDFPQLGLLAAICRVLGVSSDYLLGLSDAPGWTFPTEIPTPPPRLVGERLREARLRKKWSQAELLSYLSGTLRRNGSSVGLWESERTCPAPDTILNLGRLLGVSHAYLLGESDDPMWVGEVLSERRFCPDTLRRIRKERGLTQKQLARAVYGRDANPQNVQAWEYGRIKPNATSLSRLSRALGVPESAFFVE